MSELAGPRTRLPGFFLRYLEDVMPTTRHPINRQISDVGEIHTYGDVCNVLAHDWRKTFQDQVPVATGGQKLSTSFAWAYGRNIASVGWQVKL